MLEALVKRLNRDADTFPPSGVPVPARSPLRHTVGLSKPPSNTSSKPGTKRSTNGTSSFLFLMVNTKKLLTVGRKLLKMLLLAARSEVGLVVRFALRPYRKTSSAVATAVDTPWSTGPVEGRINRLKMIKRQMYRPTALTPPARVLP